MHDFILNALYSRKKKPKTVSTKAAPKLKHRWREFPRGWACPSKVTSFHANPTATNKIIPRDLVCFIYFILLFIWVCLFLIWFLPCGVMHVYCLLKIKKFYKIFTIVFTLVYFVCKFCMLGLFATKLFSINNWYKKYEKVKKTTQIN